MPKTTMEDVSPYLIEMIQEGASYKDIASELGFSVNTVRCYASKLRKMGHDIPHMVRGGYTTAGKKYVTCSYSVERKHKEWLVEQATNENTSTSKALRNVLDRGMVAQ